MLPTLSIPPFLRFNLPELPKLRPKTPMDYIARHNLSTKIIALIQQLRQAGSSSSGSVHPTSSSSSQDSKGELEHAVVDGEDDNDDVLAWPLCVRWAVPR